MKKISVVALLSALALILLTACGTSAQEPPPPPDFPPFSATLLEIRENSFLVLADESADVRRSSGLFQVGIADAQLLDEEGNPLSTLLQLHLYDRLEVAFTGGIDESYPAQISADTITRLPKAPLTREALMELAQDPEDLDWTDFAPYESDEVGSGLYIQYFDIDDDYYLLVGGVPGEKPWYAHLCTRVTDGFVDILGEDFSIDQLFPETAVASSSEGDYPAAIQIDGKVYLLDQPMPAEIDPSAILGETTSYTDTWPSQDGETNFSRTLGLPYAQVEGGMAVLYENEWWFCYLRERMICGSE